MATRTDTKRALAAEAWRIMFEFLMSTRSQRDRVLERLGLSGLTPNDAKALATLDGQEGRTMGSLAGEWTCDASNATWIIDRLEERGLAERRTMPGDRRVKLVVLTRKGTEVRDRMMEGFFEPPAELLELDAADLKTLRDALAKLRRSEEGSARGSVESPFRRSAQA